MCRLIDILIYFYTNQLKKQCTQRNLQIIKKNYKPTGWWMNFMKLINSGIHIQQLHWKYYVQHWHDIVALYTIMKQILQLTSEFKIISTDLFFYLLRALYLNNAKLYSSIQLLMNSICFSKVLLTDLLTDIEANILIQQIVKNLTCAGVMVYI